MHTRLVYENYQIKVDAYYKVKKFIFCGHSHVIITTQLVFDVSESVMIYCVYKWQL